MASCLGCLFCLSVLAFSAGCVGKYGNQQSGSETKIDSLLVLQYAKGFEVAFCKDCKRVTVFDAWHSEHTPLQRYYLYESDSVLPKHSDGISLCIPLKQVALGSCTQVEFFRELVSFDAVKGICNGQLIYNSDLSRLIATGAVADLGDASNFDLEKILSCGAGAFFASSYGKVNPLFESLSRSGVAVVYDNEWMEADLLGRAEWIRFVACFFNKDREADSLFNITVQRYDSLKRMAADDSCAAAISVLPGENFRGTWYMPGGRSYTAQLFRDAGAEYYYSNDTAVGSRSCSVEQVLRDFHACDVWVGVSARDLQELAAKDAHYRVFEAWKRGEVYAYDNRSTDSGGNDYWESAVAHPDALLSDFVKLCHPNLLESVKWNYLRKLQP